jgi:hypothetical protein
MLENQSLELKNKTEFSLAGWIISIVFFILVAIPAAVLLYTSISIIYFVKEFPQFLKKTIKNAQTKS